MPSPWMILINVVIGAALAAWTNKWAIDIIIKRVLPKKKSVFARRIQHVVSGQLLTPDKMRGKLDDPQVADLFRRNLDDALAAFLARDLPAPDVCFAAHRTELDRLSARLRDFALDELTVRCAAPTFRDKTLRPWLAREWERLLQRSPRSLLPKPTADLAAAVAPWIGELHQSTSLRRNIRKALADWLAGRLKNAKTFNDLFPPALRPSLLVWVEEQAPMVADQLAAALETPDLQATVADAVIAAVREQLEGQGAFGLLKSKMAGWIGVEDDIRGFCARLPATLRQTFRQPDQQSRLAAALRAAAETWMRRELAADLRSPAQAERLAGMILDHAWRPETFAEFGGRAGRVLEEVASRSLQETAFRLGLDPAAPAALDLAAAKIQQALTAPATRTLLAERLDEALAAWRQHPLGQLQRFVPPATRATLSALAADEARRLIQSRLADFADQSGVWDIITESIEGYSDEQLGTLIRDIANEEFKKITLLGGAVGLVVGFVQSFIPGLMAALGL